MSKSRKINTFIVVILITCIGAITTEAHFNILRRIYDNYVMDNRDHYLPCEKLPTEKDLSGVLQQHQDMAKKIERVNPGLVGIDIDTFTCTGKADLVIWYASHSDRMEIEKIISDDTFFGIPYRLNNR